MDGELVFSIVGVVVLLVLSALFSGTETALTAVSRARMHQLERRGVRRAGRVNRLIARPERLIGAVLLGNNLVNILASAVATSILIALFGKAGVAYATAIMTALVVIFAEVLPKTYALNRPNRTALAAAPIIGPIVLALGPLVDLIQALVRKILALFGVRMRGRDEAADASEELRGALALHARDGAMIKSDRDMLDGILDLSDVEVSEIMVHRKNMIFMDADRPVREIAEELLATPYTRVPLWRDNVDNIVGVLHAKDLLRAISAAQSDATAAPSLHSLWREPWFVPETTTLIEQLNAFRARREHFALVVDEYGALMGMLTLEDILEEIVGEISDEHDVSRSAAVRRESGGNYIVDGVVTVRDLNRDFDWELPEDDAATIAGLVIHIARRIPDIGERFAWNDFSFEVMRRLRNQVTAVRIRPPRN
ncbi:MAG: HlyC/CorC family transporter [Rhodospirillaceae bacterium]|jgi:Mg2+/Co2+ transporter CorB|nr:HlyC/CorC family transporter [Rhodospirillaceae bacterium]MBT5193964.1 HlyC/CorC family transporter [Rhodospirillaceae bacterium]MBT6431162.1 HlyC/CorC family transporter [Rhodospirillaceae bacterium]